MWADELKRVLNRLRQETYNPNSMKLKCPNCEALYESGKFCIECGTRLQEIEPVFVCSSCGYRTKRGKYCPECGTKLVEQNSLVGTASADKLPMDKIRGGETFQLKWGDRWYSCGSSVCGGEDQGRFLVFFNEMGPSNC